MGRVTIFTVNNCLNCRLATAALDVRHIPYTTINLSVHPERRDELLEILEDKFSVPQVFFNDLHIGDANETIVMLKSWDKDGGALECYQQKIKIFPEPQNERLRMPSDVGVSVPPAPKRPTMNSVMTPDGRCVSVLKITKLLKDTLPLADLKYNLTVYRNSCTGTSICSAIRKRYKIDAKDAVEFCKRLVRLQILHHVCLDHDFHDSDKYFYRIQCHQTPWILNTYRIWTERVDRKNPIALVNRLAALFDKVEKEASDKEGTVDYKKAARTPSYPHFEEAVCETQKIDLAKMDDITRTAYCINVYNLMIRYAFVKFGAPTSKNSRAAFFSSIQLNLGGAILSISDLVNGVLRANRKPPHLASIAFGNTDPRKQLAVHQFDYRIHFALNCWAGETPNSSSLVGDFSASGLSDELDLVALTFCDQPNNVRLDPKSNTIHLNPIFKWYKSDFSGCINTIPSEIIGFMRGEKKSLLETMLQSSKSISVKFMEHDCKMTQKSTISFERSALTASKKSLLNMLQ